MMDFSYRSYFRFFDSQITTRKTKVHDCSLLKKDMDLQSILFRDRIINFELRYYLIMLMKLF